jgi:hypothetical protein
MMTPRPKMARHGAAVLLALHEDVEAVPFDPLLVFTDADRWSVQRK